MANTIVGKCYEDTLQEKFQKVVDISYDLILKQAGQQSADDFSKKVLPLLLNRLYLLPAIADYKDKDVALSSWRLQVAQIRDEFLNKTV